MVFHAALDEAEQLLAVRAPERLVVHGDHRRSVRCFVDVETGRRTGMSAGPRT